MVLLPPYLKDRRASGRTFRSNSIGSSSLPGISNTGQRFLPLQHASPSLSRSAVTAPTGMRTTGVGARRPVAPSPNVGASNVVHLRPVAGEHVSSPSPVRPERPQLATSAAAYLEDAPLDEAAIHEAWDTPSGSAVGVPRSTAAARERRRQVLLALTGIAVITLLFALFSGGRWIAAHVFVDVVMVGYVILLVRHRQLAESRRKVEPIRPPVNEQAQQMQLAPSYLLRSQTGS